MLGSAAFQAARGDDRAKLVDLAAAAHASMCRAALEAPGLDLDFMKAVQGSRPEGEWPQLLEEQVGKWLSRISPATVEMMGGSERMSRLLAQVRAAPTDLRTVIHCDYLFRNLIIRPAQAAVIIDFGAALVGDPRYDLAKMVWCDLDGPGGELARRLVRSWATKMELEVCSDLLNLYVCCHSLAAVAWVEKQSSPDRVGASFRRRALETYAATPKPWL
jgi:aminoglycoside phosphotransferase (APT) family kinase protein